MNNKELRYPYQKDIDSYKDIIKPFLNWLTENESIIKHKLDCDNHVIYRGYQIMMAPLVINPKVLIIGINPSRNTLVDYAGYNAKNKYKQNGDHINWLKAQLTEKPKDSFLKSFSKCFPSEQWKTIIENKGTDCNPHYDFTWINLCPIATRKAKQYRDLLDFKDHHKLNKEKMVEAWGIIHNLVNRLEELINPELVICAGKEAFKEYLIAKQYFKNSAQIEDIIKKQKDDSFLFYEPDKGAKVIGYKRTFNLISNNDSCLIQKSKMVSDIFNNQK